MLTIRLHSAVRRDCDFRRAHRNDGRKMACKTIGQRRNVAHIVLGRWESKRFVAYVAMDGRSHLHSSAMRNLERPKKIGASDVVAMHQPLTCAAGM